jgi:hypothetical protein
MHKATRGGPNALFRLVIRGHYFSAPGNEISTLLTLISLVVSGADADAH